MEKSPLISPGTPAQQASPPARSTCSKLLINVLMACATIYALSRASISVLERPQMTTIYGTFPRPGDPLKFIPCTSASVSPAIDDPHPDKTWQSRFDTNISNWNWGRKTIEAPDGGGGSYRGIYLCGYLDVPLNYWNESDARLVRLAVTKFQVSGLARRDGRSPIGSGMKSERTLFVEPGGPGGSGTSYAWRAAEQVSKRFSEGQFDVIGWDPRGVNASLPTIACYPYNADRDRWALLTHRYRAEAAPSPSQQLRYADAMNEATWQACREIHGDLPSFLSTTSVARDLDELRKAAGEERVSGYFVSYGTGIGQTYANMFPQRVGRLILDGTEYVRDHRLLGGFGWTALDNVTNAWHDGLLGECLNAGPEHCALAKPLHGQKDELTLDGLQQRVEKFIQSLIQDPIPAYTATSGPIVITYSQVVPAIYASLYRPRTWPATAQMLYELESGNATLAAELLEGEWAWDPTFPQPLSRYPWSSDEQSGAVICADSFDAAQPEDGLDWWGSLWANMTEQSWIAGNSRFQNVFPCRTFGKYWPSIPGVYRGDLNHTLSNPVLLIAETHDPATPLRNGRRLLAEMGRNARLIAHHGYGHASGDTSDCTDGIAKRYVMEGRLPDESETACFANEKPYLYSKDKGKSAVALWEEHMHSPGVIQQGQ